jgi:hypothetical protein
MRLEERRKETRLQIEQKAFLEINFLSKPGVLCVVENLSRLGVGFECEFPLKIGEELSGKLRVAEEEIEVNFVVRMCEGLFVGAEFEKMDELNFKTLTAVLTPSYVAHSIQNVSPEFLAPHVNALYRGTDFECVVFRAGISGTQSQLQIMWKGRVVEVLDGRARFVPPMLIRQSDQQFGASMLQHFNAAKDSGTLRELMSFFRSLNDVLKVWDQCPLTLHALVRKQLSMAS